jgi:hypothetical protein
MNNNLSIQKPHAMEASAIVLNKPVTVARLNLEEIIEHLGSDEALAPKARRNRADTQARGLRAAAATLMR